jgi:hypothetical protein
MTEMNRVDAGVAGNHFDAERLDRPCALGRRVRPACTLEERK